MQLLNSILAVFSKEREKMHQSEAIVRETSVWMATNLN